MGFSRDRRRAACATGKMPRSGSSGSGVIDNMSRRVLVVTSDHVGRRMAGPAIRAVNLARELAVRGFRVTLAAPDDVDEPMDGLATVQLGPYDARATIELALAHDAVVTQRLPSRAMVSLARSKVRVVYDLYDPVLHELMATAYGRPPTAHDDLDLARNRLVLETALRTGDAFICATERQRDLWLGALGAVGRLDHEEYGRDPTFRALVDVVPFGIDPRPAKAAGRILRGTLPGFDARSKILVWAGGIWNWFDPLTVIRAVHELSRDDPDVRLLFLGIRRPRAGVAETTMLDRALALARDLGAYGTSVVFNEGWVPYDERGTWLTDADIGVSAHFDTLETRFAFRTRLLDYLWAGLPVVTTRGDVLGELVERERLGAAVAAEDVGGWVSALNRLLTSKDLRIAATEAISSVRRQFEWPRVVEPLARLVAAPARQIHVKPRTRLSPVGEVVLGARGSVRKRGLAATLRYAIGRDQDTS